MHGFFQILGARAWAAPMAMSNRRPESWPCIQLARM